MQDLKFWKIKPPLICLTVVWSTAHPTHTPTHSISLSEPGDLSGVWLPVAALQQLAQNKACVRLDALITIKMLKTTFKPFALLWMSDV